MSSLRDGTDRPSRTAMAVAAGRAIGYRHLHDPLALAFLPRRERALARRARTLAARPVGADAIAIATGGLSLHAALRMAAVDAALLRALAAGCRQVVVVGAGFDTRAWRVDALTDLGVWEVDLPGTQAVKRAGLRRLGADADRAQLIEADLGEEALQAVMGAASHDPLVPTAWVWEAVAPYLPPDAVAATLEGLRSLSAPGSHLAMTFAHPRLLGPPAAGPLAGSLAQLAFRAIGEPILSSYDEWDIAHLLDHHGFRQPLVTSASAWAAGAGLPSRPDPLGAEKLVTAIRQD